MIYEGILHQHDYVFGKIMEDKETCKRFIEQTLDIKFVIWFIWKNKRP